MDVALERYLVRAEAVFRFADQAVPWVTHVFSASTDADVLDPHDTAEIAEARWGSAGARRSDPGAATRDRQGFWRYRVALHDAASRPQLRLRAGATRASSPLSVLGNFVRVGGESVPLCVRPHRPAASRRSTSQATRTSSSVVRSCPIARRST